MFSRNLIYTGSKTLVGQKWPTTHWPLCFTHYWVTKRRRTNNHAYIGPSLTSSERLSLYKIKTPVTSPRNVPLMTMEVYPEMKTLVTMCVSQEMKMVNVMTMELFLWMAMLPIIVEVMIKAIMVLSLWVIVKMEIMTCVTVNVTHHVKKAKLNQG